MSKKRMKPGYMYAQDNKASKRTKKDIKILQDHTVIIGEKNYHAPKSVKNDKVAKAKWLEIMNLYKEAEDVPITTNADIGLLERYCLTYSEYQQLILTKRAILELHPSDLVKSMEVIHKLRLEMKLNQKNTILLRMDEQLFLTPLSKCRAMPAKKKQDPEKSRLNKKGFKF